MDHFEKVEKLRQSANVSYEEAKIALESADWDLLEAIVLLENTGRLKDHANPAYSTRREEAEPYREEAPRDVKSVFTRLGETISRWINSGNRNFLQIARKGKVKVEINLTAVVLILLIAMWFFHSVPFLIILFIISLIFGYRYSFRGENPNTTANKVMDKAAKTVEHIRFGTSDDGKRYSARSDNFKE